MIIELNIGLNVTNGDNRMCKRSDRAVLALRTLAGWITFDRRAYSQTEETLILVCHVDAEDRDEFNAVVFELSADLQQDCIAVYNATSFSGALIGPNAAAWGEFNPDFFIRYDAGATAQIYTPKAAAQSVTYTGHGAATGGLQGHSVGSDYPYMIVGVQDRAEAPTEWRVMDTRTSKMSDKFPTQQRAIIEMSSLRIRNCMHS